MQSAEKSLQELANGGMNEGNGDGRFGGGEKKFGREVQCRLRFSFQIKTRLQFGRDRFPLCSSNPTPARGGLEIAPADYNGQRRDLGQRAYPELITIFCWQGFVMGDGGAELAQRDGITEIAPQFKGGDGVIGRKLKAQSRHWQEVGVSNRPKEGREAWGAVPRSIYE